MRRRFPFKILAALIIVVFGIIRMPLEHSLEKELRAKHFRDSQLDLSMREQIGQAGFVASLGGFRSLVASILYLEAHTEFEKYAWGKVERDYAIITGLQPRTFDYWDSAQWHMAFNAYGYYMRAAANEPNEWDALRMKTKDAPYYRDRGREFLEEGLKFLPDNPEMYRLMGELYRQKYEDPCTAADWYLKGSKKPGARSYLIRGYLYMITQCAGREAEAYAALKTAYDGGNTLPTVMLGYERSEDRFIDAEIANASEQELIQSVAAPDANSGDYLPMAHLARYFVKKGEWEKAVGVYAQIVKTGKAPQFYSKKLGIALSMVPGKEKEALLMLEGFLAGKRRDVYTEVEEAVNRLKTGR